MKNRIGLGVPDAGRLGITNSLLLQRLEETTEWPPCLQAAAATCDILSEAEKLTLRQSVMVFVPYQVLALLE